MLRKVNVKWGKPVTAQYKKVWADIPVTTLFRFQRGVAEVYTFYRVLLSFSNDIGGGEKKNGKSAPPPMSLEKLNSTR